MFPFHVALILFGKVLIQLFFLHPRQYGVLVFKLWNGNQSRVGKTVNWNLLTPLKIGLVSHPSCAEEMANTNNFLFFFFWFEDIMVNWRCSWSYGYRRRKWTRRHEFKSWMRLVAFHIALIPLGKVWIQLFSLQLWVNSRTDWVLRPGWGN